MDASLLGYLGMVCGDQKYSNTIPEPAPYELSLVLSGTPRYRTKTAPNSVVEVYRQGIWVVSPRFRHVPREMGKCSYRATPRDAYEYF